MHCPFKCIVLLNAQRVKFEDYLREMEWVYPFITLSLYSKCIKELKVLSEEYTCRYCTLSWLERGRVPDASPSPLPQL
jgi:hypothetical protein